MKILSVEQCDELSEHLKVIDNSITRYCDQIMYAIKLFDSEQIVQSFYASGGFGKGMEKKLEEVRVALQKYQQLINSDGGLIPVTKAIIDDQRSILIKNNGGA